MALMNSFLLNSTLPVTHEMPPFGHAQRSVLEWFRLNTVCFTGSFPLSSLHPAQHTQGLTDGGANEMPAEAWQLGATYPDF